MTGVSGGLGATNACTWMYRPAFIAKHGVRSYKVILGSLVPGARGSRPQYGHHFSDEGFVGAALFGYFFLL
jgi:hypothetical protein